MDFNRVHKLFKIKSSVLSDNHQKQRQEILSSFEKRGMLTSSAAINKFSEKLADEVRELSKIYIESLIDSMLKNSFVLDLVKEQIISDYKKFIYSQTYSKIRILQEHIKKTGLKGIASDASINRLKSKINIICDLGLDEISLEIEEQNSKQKLSIPIQEENMKGINTSNIADIAPSKKREKWYQNRTIQAAIISPIIATLLYFIVTGLTNNRIPVPILYDWDFQIENFIIECDVVAPGDTIRVTAFVKNTGMQEVGTFYTVVKIARSGAYAFPLHDTHMDLTFREKYSLRVVDLLKGQTGTVNYVWALPETLSLGIYEVMIEVWNPPYLMGGPYQKLFDTTAWEYGFEVLKK